MSAEVLHAWIAYLPGINRHAFEEPLGPRRLRWVSDRNEVPAMISTAADPVSINMLLVLRVGSLDRDILDAWDELIEPLMCFRSDLRSGLSIAVVMDALADIVRFGLGIVHGGL